MWFAHERGAMYIDVEQLADGRFGRWLPTGYDDSCVTAALSDFGAGA